LNTFYPRTVILFFTLLIPVIAVTQVTEADSLLLQQQATRLIAEGNYASAHLILEDYLQKAGMKPFFTCMMVENGLTHYYRQENYQFFLLKDQDSPDDPKSSQNVRIGRLRYPRRILENLLNQYPEHARTYKLLGDYYNLQLADISNFDFIREDKVKKLEEKIYTYYSQAIKLGYKDTPIFRWMGNYLADNKQMDEAEKYYLKNVTPNTADPVSLLRLAEINFQKKLYTQAFNYANRSLELFPREDIYLKYDALRLSSNSLKELGDEERFIERITECFQLVPELQTAYLDLIEFYNEKQEYNQAEEIFQKMFLSNPFDLKGYRYLEVYLKNTRNYAFADTLFEELQLIYEDWDEVMANIYWSKGNLSYQQNRKTEASRFWEISRNYMRKYLPEDHPLIKQVGEMATVN
jgi:tetratricopeptide (TPR) repeat protein